MCRFVHTWLILLGLAVLAVARPAGALPMLVLDIDGQGPVCSPCVASGETVHVAVYGDGIPAGSDGLGLFGFGFRVTFATGGGLVASSPMADSQWTGLVSTDVGPGEVGVTANLFGPIGGSAAGGPSGDRVALGTFDLEVVFPGVYTLRLEAFTGAGDNVLFDGTSLDDGSNPSFFTSGRVPEPGLGLLVALAGVVALRPTRGRRMAGTG